MLIIYFQLNSFILSLHVLYLLAMLQVADLRSSMQKNWPTLACPSGNGVSFWTHEWEKHGTCSESVLDQHGYFQAALSLQKQAKLLQALASAGKSSSFSHSPAPFRVVP
jgi:ribonuclease T2